MKPNVLFVNLPLVPHEYLRDSISNKRTEGSSLAIPLGILYISSQLKAQNDAGKVGLLDYTLHLPELAGHASIEDFVLEEARRRVSFRPDIIGISLLFSTSHRLFEVVVTGLRALWPKATIVVGGIHATNCAARLLEYAEVDYVLRGEGEIGFAQFVQQYRNGQPIKVRGIYGKADLPAEQALDLCDFVEQLDELPFPDWDLIDMERYVCGKGGRRNFGQAADRRICSILTTRGCPVRCTFCSAHTVHGRRVRYRSIESVIDEIRCLHQRWGVTLFTPRDDLLTADKTRLLDLIHGVKELNIPGLEFQFSNGLHVNTLDEEILDHLVELGTQTVTLAIESGSEYVQRKIIKKNCNLAKARRLVKLCRAKGLLTRCYFILGFPGETKELMQETARYIRDLGADWCAILTATPLIGSEMYQQFLARGDIVEDVELWSSAHFWRRRFDTVEISAAELNDFIYRLNLEVNFVNNTNLRTGDFDRAITLFSDITLTYPFHIFAWYGLHRAHHGKGDAAEAQAALEKMSEALATDHRAREMYEQYGDLLPDLPLELPAAASCAG